jgi:hypothetical protein
MAGKTYNPKKVLLTFGGIPISGYAKGTFIKVTPAADTFTKKVGADGEVARAQSSDDTSEVTITLMKTSDSNVYLNTIKESDKLIDDGVLPLSITDLSSGREAMFWAQAWIKKAPDKEYGDDVPDRTWTLDTGQATQGSN